MDLESERKRRKAGVAARKLNRLGLLKVLLSLSTKSTAAT